MRRTSEQVIAASPSDLKNNRLGLMSPEQLRTLQTQIEAFQGHNSQLLRRALTVAAVVTFGVVLLSFVRVIWLPVALGIEFLVVGSMLYLTTDVNRFMQQLALDCESESVRIVKGRTSRYTLRTHPLYYSLRVELDTYKLLDGNLAREFTTGDLYQYYVLPQSLVIIAAERTGEKSAHFLH